MSETLPSSSSSSSSSDPAPQAATSASLEEQWQSLIACILGGLDKTSAKENALAKTALEDSVAYHNNKKTTSLIDLLVDIAKTVVTQAKRKTTMPADKVNNKKNILFKEITKSIFAATYKKIMDITKSIAVIQNANDGDYFLKVVHSAWDRQWLARLSDAAVPFDVRGAQVNVPLRECAQCIVWMHELKFSFKEAGKHSVTFKIRGHEDFLRPIPNDRLFQYIFSVCKTAALSDLRSFLREKRGDKEVVSEFGVSNYTDRKGKAVSLRNINDYIDHLLLRHCNGTDQILQQFMMPTKKRARVSDENAIDVDLIPDAKLSKLDEDVFVKVECSPPPQQRREEPPKTSVPLSTGVAANVPWIRQASPPPWLRNGPGSKPVPSAAVTAAAAKVAKDVAESARNLEISVEDFLQAVRSELSK